MKSHHLYNMSKYYSYIFYADRNVRPWMILGYTLTTFPKVAIYIFMHNPRRNKDLAQLQEKGIYAMHAYAMHEYISEFTSIMEHAHSIKPTDTTSTILASNFIDGI